MKAPISRGAHLAERVLHRLARIASDTPRARVAAECRFRAERDAHRARLPGPSPDDHLLASLRAQGIALAKTEDLDLGGVMLSSGPFVTEILGTTSVSTPPTLLLPPDRIVTAPEMFRWGAGDRILDLIERYLEVPVAYHGVYLRRDRAVPRSIASNRWHLDMEDRKVVKVIVYLTDVQDGDGAFRYIPLQRSLELRHRLGLAYRLGADADMCRLIPEDEWQTAQGPAGTVLVCDTALLFHKGHRPQRRDRVALFYDYTSRQPLHPYYCKSSLPLYHLREVTAGLSGRAHDCVFWRPDLKTIDPRLRR